MTLDEIVEATRNAAGDRDPDAYRYTYNDIVLVLADVRRSLGVRKVANVVEFALVTTPGEETITPEPTDLQGEILATAGALRILTQTYRQRVDSGTIGVTWQSGLEHESTINQERAYKAMITDVERELEALIVMANITTFATRPQ
jgi:hypothetical protein